MPETFGLDSGLDFDLGIPKKRKRKVDSFTPEAEESLLTTLGRGALSGVAAVGNLLDLPGSSVRDVIAGENPFDQWNPFDGSMVGSHNRTTGRDLLRQAGLISNQDTYGNWWGGLGAEIALDPTTYLTLGGSALTKGGQAFKAANVLDDAAKVGLRAGKKVGPRLARMTTTAREGFDLLDDAGKAAVNEYLSKNAIDFADIADQPLQTMARVGLPFTDIGFNVGSGKASQFAAGLLDTAGEFLKQTGPVRAARALFDSKVGGKLGYADQQIAEEAYKAKWKSDRAVKQHHVEFLKEMAGGYKAFRESFETVDDLADIERQIVSQQGKVDQATAALDAAERAGTGASGFGDARNAFLAASRDMDSLLNQRDVLRRSGNTTRKVDPSTIPAYEAYDRLVRLTGELGDDADVEKAWQIVQNGAPNLSDAAKASVQETAKSFRTLNTKLHKEFLSKGGKSGTIADRLADDATDTMGFSHMPRSVDVRPKDLADLRNPKVLKSGHSNAMARDTVARTIPTEIKNQMLTDQAVRDALAADKAGSTNTAAALIEQKYGQHLDPTHEIGGNAVGKTGHADELAKWVDEHKQGAMHTAGMVDDELRYLSGVHLANRNMDAMHEIVSRTMDATTGDVTVQRAFRNAGLSDEAIEHWAKKNKLDPRMAEGMRIPADVANAIAGVNRIYQEPEWMKTIGDALDSWNQFWKSAVTIPFPSFHSRNFTSGQFMNVATGLVQTPADLAAYGSEVHNAMKMVAQQHVPQELMEELYINGVRGAHTKAADVSIDMVRAGEIPGQLQNPFNAIDTFKRVQDGMSPSYLDAVPGGKAARTGLNFLGETGGRVADNVEFMNRVPLYLYLKKKGWSPAEAAAKVNELHVDYKETSGFEKSVMRRLVPFYTFQRRIAPAILRTILERPGGFLAQSIKASADLHNEDPLTPEHVSSTLAIPNPLKGDDYAGKSYITGLGLPHEQLLQYVGGPRTVLREAASQLNPLVKAPIEWATGQSLFQAGPGGKGRDLEELDPTLGRIYANVTGAETPPKATALEFFASALPTSRLATTARQLTDPRKNWAEKAINFGTGARVTDVDLKAQERVVQNRALDLMQSMGARTFEKPYFPAEVEAEMTPDEAAQADALELLQAVLADRQKKRKAKKP